MLSVGDGSVQLGTVGIHSQFRDLAALQLVLYLKPVVSTQKVTVAPPEAATGIIALQLQPVLQLLGQKNHAVFKHPNRRIFLAGLTV
jgi:hypothetical protein